MAKLTRRVAVAALFVAVGVLAAPALHAQKIDDATRNRNRERLASLLESAASATNLSFTRSDSNPFTYSAVLTRGLQHADSIEVVIGATDVDTVFLRAFPKYKGSYINVDKVRDPATLMRQALKLSARTFLYWGADGDGDIFFGFTFTLESGFPNDAIRVVLRSIATHDQYIAELKSAIE